MSLYMLTAVSEESGISYTWFPHVAVSSNSSIPITGHYSSNKDAIPTNTANCFGIREHN